MSRFLILIIDDHVDSANCLSRLLKLEGYQVAVHTCGGDLLKRLHEPRPCLIILDHNMPGLTGTDCVRQIRATPNWAAAPIIVFTADTSPSVRIEALEAGAQHCLIKGSVDLKSLIATVKTLAGPPERSTSESDKGASE